MCSQKNMLDYQHLFHASATAMLVLRPDHPHYTILDANSAYLAMTATQRDALLGRGILDIFAGPDRPSISAGAYDMIASLQRVVSRLAKDAGLLVRQPVPGSDGTPSQGTWSTVNSPVMNEQGQITHILLEVRDATAAGEQDGHSRQPSDRAALHRPDAKAAETGQTVEALRSSEARVRELETELLHVSRLSTMGSMAATLAHELTQPLTVIVNYVSGSRDLLERPSRPAIDTVRDALAEAEGEAVRAGQIVRRLRDFVARGEVDKRIEVLPKLIEEANSLALLGAREKDVHTTVRHDPRAELVLVDRVQIQQVLVNLVRNAIEAIAGRDQRKIQIETRVLGPREIEVAVADTGPGLSPEIAERLFLPFVSTKADGMGLGLSICRRIVEAHDGTLRAERNPAGGTTFRFTLPRVEAPELAA